MTSRALILAVLVGCGHPRAAPTLHNATPANDPSLLVQRADRALAASLRPDFEEPFAAAPPDRGPVRALYLDACRAGVHRACWIASALHPHETDPDPEAEALVIANCRAGDLASCRAIRTPVAPTDDLPGHAGRSCWGTPLAKRFQRDACTGCSKPCNPDVATLHHECAAGFPLSCRLASFIDDGHPDANEDPVRIHAIERADCASGMVRECDLESSYMVVSATRTALARDCQLAIDRCRDLGDSAYNEELSSPTDDPIVARGAYERLCQFSPVAERAASCAPLIDFYTAGAAPEAAPGRISALQRWQVTHPAPADDD